MMRRQDILVSALHCLGYSRLHGVLRRRGGKAVTRFVTFHDIPDDAVQFEANLAYLKGHTHVVGMDDYMRGRLSPSRLNVVISFDDGYRSWYTRAMPALRKLELPAIFFVSSGFVGLTPPEQAAFVRFNLKVPAGSARGVAGLSVDELRALADAGFTIGGHTANHVDLAQIDDRPTLEREIGEDKQRLEEMLQRRVDYFAYPSGSFRNPRHDLPSIVAAAGYRAAATTLSGFNDHSTDPFLLHRDLTNARMPALPFRARACGSADAVRFVRQHVGHLFGGRPLKRRPT